MGNLTVTCGLHNMQQKYPIQEPYKYFIIYLWEERKIWRKNLLCWKISMWPHSLSSWAQLVMAGRTQSFRAEPAGWAGVLGTPSNQCTSLSFFVWGDSGHILSIWWLSKCTAISQFPSIRHRNLLTSWNSFPREQQHGSAVSHQEYCQFPLEAPTSVEARFKPEVIKQKTLHIYEKDKG